MFVLEQLFLCVYLPRLIITALPSDSLSEHAPPSSFYDLDFWLSFEAWVVQGLWCSGCILKVISILWCATRQHMWVSTAGKTRRIIPRPSDTQHHAVWDGAPPKYHARCIERMRRFSQYWCNNEFPFSDYRKGITSCQGTRNWLCCWKHQYCNSWRLPEKELSWRAATLWAVLKSGEISLIRSFKYSFSVVSHDNICIIQNSQKILLKLLQMWTHKTIPVYFSSTLLNSLVVVIPAGL